jgi:HEPN domain-containing protein
MPTRSELKRLAEMRLAEAKSLIDNRYYDGAIYLAGYALEMALKARICKVLDLEEYLDTGEISKSFKTHDFDILRKLSGLERKFDEATKSNPSLHKNWSVVTKWEETYRYKPVGYSKKENAQDIINALEDSKDGVLTWIKKYW